MAVMTILACSWNEWENLRTVNHIQSHSLLGKGLWDCTVACIYFKPRFCSPCMGMSKNPRVPTHIFNDRESKGFFGSEILAKRHFFGSMKDVRIFLGHEKTGIFWGTAPFISSSQQ